MVAATPLRQLSSICMRACRLHAPTRSRLAPFDLRYCACHNFDVVLTRCFRRSFSSRSPAIWTSRGNDTVGIGQFPGALKSHVHTALLQFWQTRYHARRDKSSPEARREGEIENGEKRRVAVIRNDDDDDDGFAMRNRFAGKTLASNTLERI